MIYIDKFSFHVDKKIYQLNLSEQSITFVSL